MRTGIGAGKHDRLLERRASLQAMPTAVAHASRAGRVRSRIAICAMAMLAVHARRQGAAEGD